MESLYRRGKMIAVLVEIKIISLTQGSAVTQNWRLAKVLKRSRDDIPTHFNLRPTEYDKYSDSTDVKATNGNSKEMLGIVRILTIPEHLQSQAFDAAAKCLYEDIVLKTEEDCRKVILEANPYC